MITELKDMKADGYCIWLTIDECAEYLGLTKRAIYNHVHKGSLPARKLGRRLMFDAAEVDRAIKSPNGRRRLPTLKTPSPKLEFDATGGS